VASIDDELRRGVKQKKKNIHDIERMHTEMGTRVYQAGVLMGAEKRRRKESFAVRETERSFPGA